MISGPPASDRSAAEAGWQDSWRGDALVVALVMVVVVAFNWLHVGAYQTLSPVDEFQHVIYDNPKLTPKERCDAWLELEKKYRPYMDFDDVDFYARGSGWQRQLHIYQYPFYYIDYCLAQTVALSTSTIERLEREGQFPKRRQLSGQRVGWLVREVQEWAESRPVSNLPPPPNTGAPKPRSSASA